MHRVQPKVFLVAETKVDIVGMEDYLKHVDGREWIDRYMKQEGENPPSVPSDPELLIEFMGKLCYRSWKPGLNANVTKVREGNAPYIKNIIGSRHGSVFEHASASFIFADVSRVFTHELVRHRAGTAFSQESLRYVRLEDLGLWLPDFAENDPKLVELFEKTFTNLENLQVQMAMAFGLDEPGTSFDKKKAYTSFMRRVAPEGLATTIGFTANMRSLRHILELRTAKDAEVEIRFVIDQVAKICVERWPAIFQDFKRHPETGAWVTENSKI